MSSQELKSYKLVPTRNEYTPEQKSELIKHYHTDIVDNDILADLVILYPHVAVDKDGKNITIDDEEMNNVVNATNFALDDKLKRPLNKLRTWIDGKNPDNVDFVPVIKDHEDKADNKVGYSRGYLEHEIIGDIPCVVTKVLISDLDAKKKIKEGLLSGVSVGIRENYTLKEISFVNNPALPDAGLLSEPAGINNKQLIDNSVAKQFIDMQPMMAQLSEINKNVMSTQKELKETENKLKRNRLMYTVERGLYKLLKEGKVLPRDFEDHRYNFAKLETAEQVRSTLNILTQTRPLYQLGETHNRNADFNILGEALMSDNFEIVSANIDKAIQKLNKKSSYRNSSLKGGIKLSQPDNEDKDEEKKLNEKEDDKNLSDGKEDDEKRLSEDETRAKLSTYMDIVKDTQLSEAEKISKLKSCLMTELGEEEAEEIPQDDHIKKLTEDYAKLTEENGNLTQKIEGLQKEHQDILSKIDSLATHINKGSD